MQTIFYLLNNYGVDIMKNKMQLLILFIVFFSFQACLRGQHRYLSPGVTDDIVSAIQIKVHTVINDKYEITQVLNIDSSLGGRFSSHWREVGPVENPYGTLTHCFVFKGTYISGGVPSDSASGIVGVFKDGKILWHSNDVFTSKYGMSGGLIWAIKDINRDGKVEILVNFLAGASFPGMQNLWIIRWDGVKGEIINAKDKDGYSIIQSSGSWDFNLADVEGNGLWEIQGAMGPRSAKDKLRKIPDTDYALYTYSWNGSLYGLWQSTPQPSYGANYPRNKAQVDVSASTRQNGNVLDYNYNVHNLTSSFQLVEEFAIDRLVDTVKFNSTRKFWKGYRPWLPVIEWWCSGSYGINYIRPGETEPSFSFTTVTPSLPKILKFYSFGLNEGVSNDRDDSLDNSFRGLTIGPSHPPKPFIPLRFLDTLSGYINRSRSFGWIKDQPIANKYLDYFESAKNKLQNNNIGSARTTLQQILQDVNVDSTANLTSEAYALIRYNTEYLLEKLSTK
jgi:hypothetical protein